MVKKSRHAHSSGLNKSRMIAIVTVSMKSIHAVLYTRAGCCLCDEAKKVLAAHGLALEEIDIDADPQLRDRYSDCVPVVVIDGRERFRGRVDERLLKRLL
jgi:glutaredoxin